MFGSKLAEEIAIMRSASWCCLAYGVPSDELLVGRAGVTRLLEQGLAFARVGAGSKHAC